MAIMHKGTSPATLTADRTNSLKSTGPVTELGQLVSRRSIFHVSPFPQQKAPCGRSQPEVEGRQPKLPV
jgi:hypothetical protein